MNPYEEKRSTLSGLPTAILTALMMFQIPSAAVPGNAGSEEPARDAQDETSAGRPDEILAIVKEVTGAVSAELAGRVVPVRAYQFLRSGTSFHLATGAWLTIACGGGVVKIEESGPVTAERCRAARKSARSLDPHRRRVTLWNGSPTLEAWTRPGDSYYEVRPVLIRPRCPNELSWDLGCPLLLEQPAEIAWTELEGISRYDVALDALGAVKIKDPDCQAHPSAGNRVCSVPWPEEWRTKPGETRFLQVTARIDLFESARSEKTKIEILPADAAAGIKEDVAAIRKLGLDASTRTLALASFFAERKLYNEAVAVLEEAVREESDLVLHLALGDAYVKVAWPEAASFHYRHVLDRLAQEERLEPELQAAAELGLGWANYLDDRILPAQEHFGMAAALAERHGLPALAAQADEMIKRISRK